jgi:hypothetical protein
MVGRSGQTDAPARVCLSVAAIRLAFRDLPLGGLALGASIMHLQGCGGPEGLILGAAAIASGGV